MCASVRAFGKGRWFSVAPSNYYWKYIYNKINACVLFRLRWLRAPLARWLVGLSNLARARRKMCNKMRSSNSNSSSRSRRRSKCSFFTARDTFELINVIGPIIIRRRRRGSSRVIAALLLLYQNVLAWLFVVVRRNCIQVLFLVENHHHLDFRDDAESILMIDLNFRY